MMDHLFELIAGAYIFAAGAYIFGWRIYQVVVQLKVLLTNHLRHEIDDMRNRLDRLDPPRS